MRPPGSKGPAWDQRLDERWRSLPRAAQRRWVWCSFVLYLVMALLVFLQARKEMGDKEAPGYGTIRNPITENANNLQKKER